MHVKTGYYDVKKNSFRSIINDSKLIFSHLITIKIDYVTIDIKIVRIVNWNSYSIVLVWYFTLIFAQGNELPYFSRMAYGSSYSL